MRGGWIGRSGSFGLGGGGPCQGTCARERESKNSSVPKIAVARTHRERDAALEGLAP